MYKRYIITSKTSACLIPRVESCFVLDLLYSGYERSHPPEPSYYRRSDSFRVSRNPWTWWPKSVTPGD